MDEQPDYAGIAARAKAGEYHVTDRHPPIPDSVFPRSWGALDWHFGKDLERYLEMKGVQVPRNAKSITLRYERDENRIHVTVRPYRGKKRRYYIFPPLIDNMEASDT